MRRIAVTMTYYDRRAQYLKTLETIKQTEHTDYRIFVVDDASIKDPLDVADPVADIIRVEPEWKRWKMTVAFNTAIVVALRDYNPEIIIVQNAECYHVGDVLMYADRHVQDRHCVSFACWNDEGRDPDPLKAIAADTDHTYGSGWYNHPINARFYNFCNAYTRADMLALNGMDERFKDGIGYADDNLVFRSRAMGLDMYITNGPAEPFVVHQFHERAWHDSSESWDRNRTIHHQICEDEEHNYRARHLVTEDFDAVEYSGNS